jgi:hypothetical protein
MQALSMQQLHGWSPFIALHAQYSLVERGIEREVLPLIVQENLGLLAWSPLAGGFLSGKYTPKNAFAEKTRLGGDDLLAGFYREIAVNPRGWAILDTLSSPPQPASRAAAVAIIASPVNSGRRARWNPGRRAASLLAIVKLIGAPRQDRTDSDLSLESVPSRLGSFDRGGIGSSRWPASPRSIRPSRRRRSSV